MTSNCSNSNQISFLQCLFCFFCYSYSSFIFLILDFSTSFPYVLENASAVESLAIVQVDAIAQITRVINVRHSGSSTSSLPRESAFIVEVLKKVFQWGTKIRTMEHLVGMVITDQTRTLQLSQLSMLLHSLVWLSYLGGIV